VGGGALGVLLARKKGHGEKNLGRQRPTPFKGGGGAVGRGWGGGGAMRQRRMWGTYCGARAALSVGSGPTPAGVGERRVRTQPTPNKGGLSHRQVGSGPQ
jgi:hypothetical protein